MAVQMHCKSFSTHVSLYYCNHDEIRSNVLEKVNKFFLEHDGYDIVNTIEKWDFDRCYFQLTVYYKSFI